MALQDFPAWPFEPNWSTPFTERLEWLTDIMMSPTGAEQRRGIRRYPRVTYEYAIVADGEERSLLDNIITSFGAGNFYVPVWFDAHFLAADANSGATTIMCATAALGKLRVGGAVYFVGKDVFDYELAEVQSFVSGGFTISAPLAKTWLSDTRIHPAVHARLTDQPSLTKRNEKLVVSSVRFQLIEGGYGVTGSPGLTEFYLSGAAILSLPPDESKDLTFEYVRLLEEIDNSTSFPIRVDTSGKDWTLQQYTWFIEGRAEHQQVYALLYYLRGRATPLWMPTFMQDLVLVADIESGDTTITTARSGFLRSGGPRWDRQHIMIETETDRFYRQILDGAQDDTQKEILLLDTAIGTDIAVDDVVRICFITFVRLNQDSVEIEHTTDLEGVSSMQLAFRSTTDQRMAPVTF